MVAGAVTQQADAAGRVQAAGLWSSESLAAGPDPRIQTGGSSPRIVRALTTSAEYPENTRALLYAGVQHAVRVRRTVTE